MSGRMRTHVQYHEFITLLEDNRERMSKLLNNFLAYYTDMDRCLLTRGLPPEGSVNEDGEIVIKDIDIYKLQFNLPVLVIMYLMQEAGKNIGIVTNNITLYGPYVMKSLQLLGINMTSNDYYGVEPDSNFVEINDSKWTLYIIDKRTVLYSICSRNRYYTRNVLFTDDRRYNIKQVSSMGIISVLFVSGNNINDLYDRILQKQKMCSQELL